MKKQATAVDLSLGEVKTIHLEIVPRISLAESEDLERCELKIRQHIDSYFEAAYALKQIHDQRLYRGDFPTFEAYVVTRWGWGRNYAHRLVKAANLVQNVLGPLGNVPLPENESQVRPLTVLPPEKARRVWKEVVKEAKGGKVTASLVIRIVGRMLPEPGQSGLSFTQKEIKKLLSAAAEAVASGDFESALRQVNAAQVRIDVEAIRAKRGNNEGDLQEN